MPLSIIIAGGPHSVRLLSNFFGLGAASDFNCPLSFNKGFQSYKLSDHARLISCSPQYIQYFPLMRATTCLPFSIFVMIDPDLLQSFKNLPSYAFAKAGPFFCQCIRSLENAMDNLAVLLFHAVYATTYNPSSVC